MALWIRTGYGVLETPLQGTSDNPFLSLLQGSGMGPWVFLLVSTLMVEGYKSLGHGCKYVLPITLTAFALAVILFVDDTGLLMRAKSATATPEESIKYVQQVLTNWANLVMSSGGSLKQSKSFTVVKTFNYSSGRARLNETRVLPAKTLTIPQRTGGDVTIPILDIDAPKKAFGI